MIKTIHGAAFSRMMLSAAAEIDLNKQKVNELNVFPVPDGDTGTNMSMTLSAASTEPRKADGITLTKAADKTASALLRGARGNSGVILSLLFRGFSKSLKGKLEADGKDFAASALTAGVEAAYKAVMKPAEGTILTVSRLTADAARDLAEENNEIESVLERCLDTAHAALDNTVNQNPVLKKAGVVDAGGMGFCLILRGMLESLRGNDIVCERQQVQRMKRPISAFSTLRTSHSRSTRSLLCASARILPRSTRCASISAASATVSSSARTTKRSRSMYIRIFRVTH